MALFDVDVGEATYEVDAPDERTAWKWANATHIKEQKPKASDIPAFEREARETLSSTLPERIAANPIVRAATTASKAVGIPYNMLADQMGLGNSKIPYKQLEEMQARGTAQMRDPIGEVLPDWLQLPKGFAGGAADVSGVLLSPLTGVAAKVPAATGYLGKIAQWAELGALGGLTAGSDKPLEQAATGAVVSGAIPAVGIPLAKAGTAAYHVAEPLFASAAIKGRAFLDAAGDKADDIIALLHQNKQLVPGSLPTAGEAAVPAGRAEFAALQQSAASVKPSDYLTRTDAQNAARLAAVRTVGKDKAVLEAAETARSTAAKANYGAAYGQAIKADPRLATLAENPYFKDALPDAIKLAEARSISSKTDLTQFLHFAKLSLDKQIAKTGDTALSNTEKAAVAKVKNQLVDWLRTKNPAYDAARSEFAKASVPINQMQVGQYLESKLVPAVSDEAKQSAAQYSTALRDASGTLLKRSGVQLSAPLEKVLTPQQLEVVNSVQDDLARLSRFSDMAKVGSRAGPTAVDLATSSMEKAFGGKAPNLLHRGVMITNAIVTRLEGKINAKLASEIAAEMLNPPVVAQSMEKALARQKMTKALSEAIERSGRVVATAESQRQ